MQSDELTELVVDALEEIKGDDIRVLDVSAVTTIADVMVVASGGSNRQVQSLADNLLDRARARGVRALGVEGREAGEWVLVDLGDVIVHIMRPEVRAFYNLEKLWDIGAEEVSRAGRGPDPQ